MTPSPTRPKAVPKPVPAALAARLRPDWGGWRTILLCGLLMAFDGGLLSGILLVGRQVWGPPVSQGVYAALLLRCWLLPLVLLAMGAYPGYAVHPARKLRQRAMLVLGAFPVLLLDLVVWHPDALGSLPGLAACHLLAMLAWPLGNRLLERLLQRQGWWGEPSVLLGAGPEGRILLRTLRREGSLGLIPLAFYDDHWQPAGRSIDGLPVLGPLRAAAEAAAWARTAIVAVPALARDEVASLVASLPFRRVLIIPDLDGIQSIWLRGTELGGRLCLDLSKKNLRLGHRFLKRGWDLLLAIPLALACAPLILVLAALIRSRSPGSPFYCQVREGQDGRRIRVWKLRTMHADAQMRLERHLARSPQARLEWQRHFKLRQDPRTLPGIGRFLRRSSLDELPQIWNVLRGDMSLVGPRPFPHYHLEAFDAPFRRLRASVRPGMTGLWQVSARETGLLEDQERLDAFYIHNWSLWLDVDVLLRTAAVVVRGTGS